MRATRLFKGRGNLDQQNNTLQEKQVRGVLLDITEQLCALERKIDSLSAAP